MNIKYIFTIITLLLVSNASRATNYTWTGSTSSAWNLNSNWSPSGIPDSADNVTISSGTYNLLLSQNQKVNNLTLSSKTIDLNGYSLTVKGNATLTSGTITNGIFYARGNLASFNGTLMDCPVDAVCGYIRLSGSTFNEIADFTDQGAATGIGSGGCTFNDDVTITHTGTLTYFTLANTTGDTFNGNVTFTNSSNREINIASNGSTQFNGNIILNSTSTGGISFCNSGGTAALASGKTISIGTSGFTSDFLTLKNFTQNGSTAQTLTLTSTAVINMIAATFNGNLTITAPGILLKNSTFNGTTTLTRNGSSGNHQSDGGNTFNILTLDNAGSSGRLRWATTTPDIYNGNATFNSTGGQDVQIAYSGDNLFAGNITINSNKVVFNTASGKVTFSGGNAQTLNGSYNFSFKKLAINKSANQVTANTTLSVDDTLFFVSKNLITSSTNLLTMKAGSVASGASNSSFVSGPVKKVGSSAFEFPVGKSNIYQSLSISAPSTSSDAFTCEFFDYGQNISSSIDTSIDIMDNCDFWSLSRSAGSTNVNVTLSWQGSDCKFTDSTDIRLLGYNGSKWLNYGKQSYTVNSAFGKISNSSGISHFNYFALGLDITHPDYLPSLGICVVPIGKPDVKAHPDSITTIGNYCIGQDFIFKLDSSSISLFGRLNTSNTYCVEWDSAGGYLSAHDSCLTENDSVTCVFNSQGNYYVNVSIKKQNVPQQLFQGGADNNYKIIIEPQNLTTIFGSSTNLIPGDTLDAGEGYESYLWSTGDTTQRIIAYTSGHYHVSVTDSFGCTSQATTQLTIDPGPFVPEVTNISNVEVCSENQFVLDFLTLTSPTHSVVIDFSVLINQGGPNGPLVIPDCFPSCLCNTEVAFFKIISASSTTSGVVVTPTPNASPNSFTFSWTQGNPTVSLSLTYEVALDCSVIPVTNNGSQYFITQQMFIDGTLVTNPTFVDEIHYPYIVNANPIIVDGNYGQTGVEMIFEYPNSGFADADIRFKFDDLTDCEGTAYDITYTQFGYSLSGPFTSFTGWQPATIPVNGSLFVKQIINIKDCIDLCEDRTVKMEWQCNLPIPATGPGYCQECLNENYLTNFSFQQEIPTYTVERILPTLPNAEYDNECAGDEILWTVKIKNTSTYATLPLMVLEFENVYDVESSLSLVSYDDISISPCTSCSSMYKDPIPFTRTNYLCDATITDAVSKFTVKIEELPQGGEEEFSFKTSQCCTSAAAMTPLFDNIKYFNQWTFTSSSSNACGTEILPTPTANDLNINLSAGINGHSESDINDLDLELLFTPSTKDMSIEPNAIPETCTNSIDYTYSNTHAIFKAKLMKIVEDIKDLQLLGFDPNDPTEASAILEVKIHCDEGLLIDNPGNTFITSTNPSVGTWDHESSWYTTSNEDFCCVGGDYTFYFDLNNAPGFNKIEDFFNFGEINFEILACCPTSFAQTPYSLEFRILPNEACYDPTLSSSFNAATCATCCWIPLSTIENDIAVHCPGCVAPGVIVSNYYINRISYGLEDSDNDGVADDPLVPITNSSSLFNSLDRKKAIHGDRVEDKTVAYFQPGDSGNGGYTYNNDITSKGLEFGSLQLHRNFLPSSAPMVDMEIESYELFIDDPNTSGSCVGCSDFDLASTSKTTVFHMTVVPNSGTLAFVEGTVGGGEILFTFEKDMLDGTTGRPTTGVTFNVDNFNDFVETQQYRLLVNYKVCGNFQSNALLDVSASDDELKKDVSIRNTMFFIGTSTNLATVSTPPQMWMTEAQLNANGWSLDSPATPPQTTINQTFIDSYKFYCETYGAEFALFSVDHINFTSYQNGSDDLNCDKLIKVTARNSIARNRWGDLFPFEFRAPSILPESFLVTFPTSDFSFTGAEIYSTVVLSSTDKTPITPSINVAGLETSLEFLTSNAPTVTCWDESLANVSGQPDLYLSDQTSRQILEISMTQTDCNLTYVFPQDKSIITFADNESGCDAIDASTAGCEFSFDENNRLFANNFIQPNPNIDLDFSFNQIIANSNNVCWDFEITNLPQFGTTPPITGAPNVFIALPDVTPTTLSNWEVSLNGGTFFSPVNGIFDVADFMDVGSSNTISGQICAEYTCDNLIPISSTIISYGWDCMVPTTNDPLSACSIQTETITLINEPVELAIDESNTLLPDVYTTCSPLTIIACYQNLLPGRVIPENIEILGTIGSNLTISGDVTVTADPSYTNILTSTTNSWNLVSDMNAIFTDGILEMSDGFCVTFVMTPECGFDGVLPDIELTGVDYCGQPISVIMAIPDVIQNIGLPSTCDDCYEITKSANVSTAVEGTELVTFTILICADNDIPTSVILQDDLPDNFDIVSSYGNTASFPFNLTAQQCTTFTVSGYLNNPGECNEAIVFGASTPSVTFSDTAYVTIASNCLASSDLTIPKNAVSSSYGSFIGAYIGAPMQVNIQGDFYINSPMQFFNVNVILDPGARIIINGNQQLYISYSSLTPCLKMWKGIEMNVGSSFFSYENSIEGAEYAVMAKTGTNHFIFNTEFEDNYISVFFPFAYLSNTAGSIISGCEFRGSGTMHPTYAGQMNLLGNVPYAGIVAHRNVLQISPANPNPNIFTGLSNGIIGLRSDLTIRNCIFENIIPDAIYDINCTTLSNNSYNGSGIYAHGFKTNYSLNQIGLGLSVPTFDNCHIGIYAERIDVLSEYNLMQDMDMGYLVNQAKLSDEIKIRHNIIESNQNGIDLRFNDASPNLVVWDNVIEFGDNSLNQFSGISVDGANLSQPGASRITYNTINFRSGATSAFNGIRVQNASNFEVSKCVINMDDNTFNRNGILLNGNFQTEVACNVVTGSDYFGSDVHINQNAIRNNMSERSILGCNIVDKTMNGIIYDGVVNFTLLQGNEFNKHEDGLRYLPTAVTNVQKFRGNLWNQSTQGIGFNANNLNPNFLPAINFNPVGSNINSTNMPNNQIPIDWFKSDPGNDFLCEDPSQTPDFVYCNEFPYDCINCRTSFDDQIARGDLDNGSFTEETAWILGKQLFQKLEENPSLLSDTLMIAFYDSLENESAGKLVKLQNSLFQLNGKDSTYLGYLDTISSGRSMIKDTIWYYMNLIADSLLINSEFNSWKTSMNEVRNTFEVITILEDSILNLWNDSIYDAAEDLLTFNATISEDNILVQNEKIVNSIFIESMILGDGSLTALQNSILYTIAKQCPMRGGRSVYMARSLFSLVRPLQTYNDEETCNIPIRLGSSPESSSQDTYMKVYPNPADEQILIKCSLPDQMSGRFVLASSTGQLVASFPLNCGIEEYKFSTKTIAPGIYFYSLNMNGLIKDRGKLVIIH